MFLCGFHNLVMLYCAVYYSTFYFTLITHCRRCSLLTHLPLVPHICVSESVSFGSDNGLSPISAPSHYLNQCWIIVNWTLRNKRQWNFNQNTKLFIHENASENIIFEMAAILSWGRWVVECQVVDCSLIIGTGCPVQALDSLRSFSPFISRLGHG